MKMRLHLHRQDALVHFFMTADTGEWFAVACARGVMRALGRKMEKDEKTAIDLEVVEIPSEIISKTRRQKIQELLTAYRVQASGGFAEALENL